MLRLNILDRLVTYWNGFNSLPHSTFWISWLHYCNGFGSLPPLNILDKLVTLLEWVWFCPPWNILNKLITHLNEFGSLPHRTFRIRWLRTGIGWLHTGMGLVPSSHWTFWTGWLRTGTPCLMHRCVISTMFGSCFSFFSKLLSFFIFIYFYAFSVFIIIFYNKNKVFLFHFCIFVYLDASLEKEDTPHSFSSRVFLHYYKFYFFLVSTLYLFSSFL
jgi:hypothetical protein